LRRLGALEFGFDWCHVPSAFWFIRKFAKWVLLYVAFFVCIVLLVTYGRLVLELSAIGREALSSSLTRRYVGPFFAYPTFKSTLRLMATDFWSFVGLHITACLFTAVFIVYDLFGRWRYKYQFLRMYEDDLGEQAGDMRTDSRAVSRLRHARAELAVFAFTSPQTGWRVFFWDTTTREVTVSLEILTQLMDYRNVQLSSDRATTFERLRAAATTLPSVNLDRTLMMLPIMSDTVHLAWGLWHRHREDSDDYPFGVGRT
jgi:hypothetical protein